ncbi:threonine synthase [Anaeromyxobacter oryzae]|uniref:Threonine synthase n=1 Tax=Anaeromyxobacter oryzae TaxID=2918170 RepID=A0ABM7WNX3_9BACT|nr:threonine synthase [Anaeromyxobacter oryzae]BDG01173.1 threonine synthase [Anaeromyxobacter oryzae]
MSSPVAAACTAVAKRSGPRLASLSCRLCGAPSDPSPVAVCEHCLGPLEPVYDPARRLPTRAEIEARPRSIWRYREWLPILDAPVVSEDTGFTPLLDAPALARALGVRRALVKNDAVSHPSCSFKDRVVAVALNAAVGLGLDTVGCASTGNLANSVAAQAARAGLAAWIFVPEDLEVGKIVGTAIYGPRLVRVKGTYDDVNRLCAQVADRFGWGLVNLNLRGYYGEGSKTMAHEIGEQLGWRTPDAVIAPMAGGSLLTKLDKGFRELRTAGLLDGAAPRMYGAQAAGCAPIVNLVASGGEKIEPVQPRTIARSIAIGNPADGRFAAKAIRTSGGGAAAVTDEELVAGIRLLAETTGVFGETAAGVTVAAALKLAREGQLRPTDELVLCITGNGLKTVEAVLPALPEAPVVAGKLREVAALVEASR